MWMIHKVKACYSRERSTTFTDQPGAETKNRCYSIGHNQKSVSSDVNAERHTKLADSL